jgi:hypothetical protein
MSIKYTNISHWQFFQIGFLGFKNIPSGNPGRKPLSRNNFELNVEKIRRNETRLSVKTSSAEINAPKHRKKLDKKVLKIEK